MPSAFHSTFLALVTALASASGLFQVAPLLDPFFPTGAYPRGGAGAPVIIEEFGAVGSSVLAYQGLCLAYTQLGGGLSINVKDVSVLLRQGPLAMTTLRNTTSPSTINTSMFEAVYVPAATSPTGRALLASTAKLFAWNASNGYPNASAVDAVADQDAVADALASSLVPALGVISYLKSLEVGLPCLEIRPANNDAISTVAELTSRYRPTYVVNQAAASCLTDNVNSTVYPLIGCITIRLVPNSTCNAAAEVALAQTLRVALDILVRTSARGVMPMLENDVAAAFTSYTAKSCVSRPPLRIGASYIDVNLFSNYVAKRNEPGFTFTYTNHLSTDVWKFMSRGNYLFGFASATRQDAMGVTQLGNESVTQMPAGLIPCFPIVNLPNRPDIALPYCSVPDIMSGAIDMWDDPRIQRANPQVTLPHEKILVAGRTDTASMTKCIQVGLAEIQRRCNRTVTFRPSVVWSYNTQSINVSLTSPTMEAIVQSTPYSIGYTVAYSIPLFELQVPTMYDDRNGKMYSRASMELKNLTVDPVTMVASFPLPDWPFVMVDNIVFTSDRKGNCSAMSEAVKLLEWILVSGDARRILTDAGFIAFPEWVYEMSLEKLHAVAKCGGEFLFAQPVFKVDRTGLIVGVGVGVPMGVVLVLMIILAVHLARERRKKQVQVQRSIELTTDIADALCDYDLEYVDYLLDEYVSNEHHNSELVKPFRSLRGNLGEYRPYIPQYLLPDASHDNESAARRSSTTSSMSRSHGGLLKKHSSNESHTSLKVAAYATLTPGAAGAAALRNIALAAVDFVGSTYCSPASKSMLTGAAVIDSVAVAVHAALKTTGGVLHAFVGDSVVASWNSAKPVQQPEKHACHFLCLLRKDPAVRGLQLTGAVSSGNAYCHAGGDSKQRTLVVCGPEVFATLHGGRTMAQEGNTLVITSAVRSVVNLNFTTMPYNVRGGESFFEILKDNSEDDENDEEWMYRVAKAENTADAKLLSVMNQWAQGRLDAALAELDSVTSNDEAVTSRIAGLRSRISAAQK